jgi:hypothetical protein
MEWSLIIYLMWVNKSVPAMAGVSCLTLVIIYLRNRPEITAPATIPKSNPNAPPTPIKAIPTVALVVQELPVAIEIIEHYRLARILPDLEFVNRNRSSME